MEITPRDWENVFSYLLKKSNRFIAGFPNSDQFKPVINNLLSSDSKFTSYFGSERFFTDINQWQDYFDFCIKKSNSFRLGCIKNDIKCSYIDDLLSVKNLNVSYKKIEYVYNDEIIVISGNITNEISQILENTENSPSINILGYQLFADQREILYREFDKGGYQNFTFTEEDLKNTVFKNFNNIFFEVEGSLTSSVFDKLTKYEEYFYNNSKKSFCIDNCLLWNLQLFVDNIEILFMNCELDVYLCLTDFDIKEITKVLSVDLNKWKLINYKSQYDSTKDSNSYKYKYTHGSWC